MSAVSMSTHTFVAPLTLSASSARVPTPNSLPLNVKFALAIALPIAAVFVFVMAAVHLILRHHRKHQAAKIAQASMEAGPTTPVSIIVRQTSRHELLSVKSEPMLRPQEVLLKREQEHEQSGDVSSMTGETGVCREVTGEPLRKLQTYDAIGKRTIYWG